jgi:hypothetical protein
MSARSDNATVSRTARIAAVAAVMIAAGVATQGVRVDAVAPAGAGAAVSADVQHSVVVALGSRWD